MFRRVAYMLTIFSMVGMSIMPLTTTYAQSDPTYTRTINVSGEARLNVVPDQVALYFMVETSNLDLKQAKAENDTKVSQALQAIKAIGVPEEKIQTDFINIEPRYESYSDRRTFIGYFVRKNISVTLSDVSKFESLLTAVLEAGVNYVQGVQFSTTELRKHRDAARAMAIKAAQEKAIAMAAELGQKVGKPLTINENSFNYYYYGSTNSSANVSQNVGQVEGSASPELTATALGQIAITASVTVTFELID